MNRRQKNILINFAIVLIITGVAVAAMIELKNRVNRSEAMRAMRHLGQVVIKYRDKHSSVPPESFVQNIKGQLQGQARLGDLQYRARWIEFEPDPCEILAYSQKEYRSILIQSGVIVLRIDGSVEWMKPKEFQNLLQSQQGPLEIEMTEQ